MNSTTTTYGQAVWAVTLATLASLGGCASNRDTSDPPERERIGRATQPLEWFETPLTHATPNDGFGYSVAMSGNTAVVAASAVAEAYVFVQSGTWQEQAKLLPPIGGTIYDGFGSSVAISGDTVIVGAPTMEGPNGASQGAAFVFVRSGDVWGEPLKLTASDGAADDHFGGSVAISEGRAIIGAWNASTENLPWQGAAYVFERSGAAWNQQTKLLASDAMGGDRFGVAVAISGATAVVGASLWPGDFSGTAYAFTDSGAGWDEQKLVGGDTSSGDEYGASVAIAGDMAVVGAPGHRGKDAPNGYHQGAAYVFVNSVSGWTRQDDVLFASDAADTHTFATSVSVSGSTVLVGAPMADSVYAFAPLTNALVQQQLGGKGIHPYFGWSLAQQGDVAVVGTLGSNGAYIEALLTSDGDACDSDSECGNHHCVANVCCNLACSGACETCASGTCTALPGSSGAPSCTPYLCGASGGPCPTSCASNGDCIETHYCLEGGCVVRQPNGATCTEARQCASGECVADKCSGTLTNGTPCTDAVDCGSGRCVDGVCCDEACGAQCEACDVPDTLGECSAVTGTPRGDREPCVGTGETCGGECDGQETAGCAYPTGSTACDQSCADGMQIDSACNGQGACEAGEPLSCGNLVCTDEVSCKTSCETSADCVTGFTCQTNGQCETGATCVDAHTSEGADGIQDCSPYLCDSSGSCRTDCTSKDDCTGDNVCDLNGHCVPRLINPSEPSGCSACSASSSRSSGAPWALLGIALAAIRLGRTRWRRRVGVDSH